MFFSKWWFAIRRRNWRKKNQT